MKRCKRRGHDISDPKSLYNLYYLPLRCKHCAREYAHVKSRLKRLVVRFNRLSTHAKDALDKWGEEYDGQMQQGSDQ